MKILYPLFLLIYLGWNISLAFASNFQAKVIHIGDGDTITVLDDAKKQIKIRLNGIDCPEKGQAFNKKATEFTKNLVAGKMVTIKTYKKDRYGRPLGGWPDPQPGTCKGGYGLVVLQVFR